MKLHITVNASAGVDGAADTFDLELASDETRLNNEDIYELVELWLLGATDSESVTQNVLDGLADRLQSSRDALEAAIDAVPEIPDPQEG